MTEFPDVGDAIAVQSNIAIILSAFAFSALVLLFNIFGTAANLNAREAGRAGTIRAGSIEARAVILMLTAFNVGIAAAYMFSSSLGGDATTAPAVAFRGFAVAQVAYGLQVLALISPVLLLVDRYVRYPAPLVTWWLAPAPICYGAFRIGAELNRAWQLEGGGGSTGRIIFVAFISPSLVAMTFYLERWLGLLGPMALRVDRFLLHSSIGYMVMVAFSAVSVGVIHYDVTSGGGAIQDWQFVVLSVLLGMAAAWTIVHTWPEPIGAKPEVRVDDAGRAVFVSEDHPQLTRLLNEWFAGLPTAERARRLRELVDDLSLRADRLDRRPTRADGEQVLNGDFGELKIYNSGHVGANVHAIANSPWAERCELDQLARALRKWARVEKRHKDGP